jgi:outer membrane protein assembly factor BamB
LPAALRTVKVAAGPPLAIEGIKMVFRCIVCAAIGMPLPAVYSCAVLADDWPQFRGPNAAGISRQAGTLPTEFSFESKVRWKADLGDGVACPIVVGGRVFCTAMVGPRRFAVFCFDASSGRQLWRQELDTGELPAITPPNSHASSTPACDGQRVFVYFSTIGLLAFDADDGREVWRHPLPVPAYLLDWGAAGSPIVWRDLVIFNQDDDLSAYLLAVDAATGEERWRTPRPDMLAGYAVPVLCEANGRIDLVVAGTGKLKGYDPATGKERWTCNTLLRTIMSSPVVHDGVIYVSVQSYGDTDRLLKSALLEWKDTNQDAKLTKAEIPKEFWQKFDNGNANGDEYLEGAEIDAAFQSPDNMVGGGRIIQAIRGGGDGDVTGTHLLWNLNNRAPSNISSPLVFGGRLYVVKRGGLSSCFDAASGETLWETKRIDNLGDYFASPVAGDGKVYIAGENGFVVVLADGPELNVLARNDMGESCVATPAIAEGALFIRTREKLYCVGE